MSCPNCLAAGCAIGSKGAGGWESVVRKTLEGAGALTEARGKDASAAGCGSGLVLRLPALHTSVSVGLDSSNNAVLLLQYAPSGSRHPRIGMHSSGSAGGRQWGGRGGWNLGGGGMRDGSGGGIKGAGVAAAMMSRDELAAMAWTRARCA